MMKYLFRLLYVNILTVYPCLVCAQNPSSWRKQDAGTERGYFENDKSYWMHIQKLREVNALKTHNLDTMNASKQKSAVIYINNPVEARMPNAYLSVSQFKDSMVQRVENQKKEFSNLNMQNKLFLNTNKRFKHDVVFLNNGRYKSNSRIYTTVKPTTQTVPKVGSDAYKELFDNFTNDIISRLKSEIKQNHKIIIEHNKHTKPPKSDLDDVLTDSSNETDAKEIAISTMTKNDTNIIDFLTNMSTTQTNKITKTKLKLKTTTVEPESETIKNKAIFETNTHKPVFDAKSKHKISKHKRTTTQTNMDKSEFNNEKRNFTDLFSSQTITKATTTIPTTTNSNIFTTINDHSTFEATSNKVMPQSKVDETTLTTSTERLTSQTTDKPEVDVTTDATLYKSEADSTTVVTTHETEVDSTTETSTTQTADIPIIETTTNKNMIDTNMSIFTFDVAVHKKAHGVKLNGTTLATTTDGLPVHEVTNESQTEENINKDIVNSTYVESKFETNETKIETISNDTITKIAQDVSSQKPSSEATPDKMMGKLKDIKSTLEAILIETDTDMIENDTLSMNNTDKPTLIDSEIPAKSEQKASAEEEITANASSVRTEQEETQPSKDPPSITVEEEIIKEIEEVKASSETPENKEGESSTQEESTLKVDQESTSAASEQESPLVKDQEAPVSETVQEESPSENKEEETPTENKEEAPTQEKTNAEGEKESPAGGEPDSPAEANQDAPASETVKEETPENKETTRKTEESQSEVTKTTIKMKPATRTTFKRKPATRSKRLKTTTTGKTKRKRPKQSKPYVFLGE